MNFRTLLVAISTYSAIPVPQMQWNEKNMRYAICWFPVVGILCGGALLLWHLLCRCYSVNGILFAAVAVCLPLLITGGIHMDGYMDTVDALASHQSRDRKLEILKDSHCGSFAVLYCGIYMILSFGLYYTLYAQECLPAAGLIYVISRAMSACCAVILPRARKNGMLNDFVGFTPSTPTAAICLAIAVLAGTAMIWIAPIPGTCAGCLLCCTTIFYRVMAIKQFGGVTGDTSGFYLQLSELLMLAGFCIGGTIL